MFILLPSKGLNFNYSSLFKGGQSVYESQRTGRDFDISVEIILPEFSKTKQDVSFLITKIDSLLPEIDYEKASRICIKDLRIVIWTAPQNQHWYNNPLSYLETPLCQELFVDFDMGGLKRVKFETNILYTNSYLNDNFYFPYDGFSYAIAAFLQYEVFDKNDNSILKADSTPNIIFTNHVTNEWYASTHSKVPLNSLDLNDEIPQEEYNKLSNLMNNSSHELKVIKIQRPLLIRIIYPAFIFLLLLFIGLLVLLEELNSFLSAALSVVFGIFAVRQVFIPETTSFHSIVDISIAILYLWFFLVSIFQIVRLNLPTKRPMASTVTKKYTRKNRNF